MRDEHRQSITATAAWIEVKHMRQQIHRCKLVMFATVISIGCALHLGAQVQYGQFAGTVTDPTDAAIANAKVTVTNAATDLSVSALTNTSGNYTVKELPPGTYKSEEHTSELQSL